MNGRRDFLKLSALAIPAMTIPWAKAAPLEPRQQHFGLSDIRKHFDINPGLVFLNNGTMGVSPKPVIEAVANSLKQINQSAVYGGWEKTIDVLANYFGALPEEIALTHNVTDGINIVAQGLNLKPGDEIIVSNQEHVGNALPWLARAQRDQLTIRVLDLTLPKEALLASLQKLINGKTRVIALPHIPCTTGRVIPAEEIGEIAQKHKLIYFLDGAHGAGLLDLDFKSMNCDFYATCTHKWMLGPVGTGFLFIRKEKMDLITPIFTGAYSDTGWNLIDGNPRLEGFSNKAIRHTNGTQSKALYDGVIAAVEFHQGIGKQEVAQHIRKLNDHLYEGIVGLTGIKILTPKYERAGMLSFIFEKKDYLDFQNHCKNLNITIRAVPENQVNAIRISTGLYNQIAEIEHFTSVLKQYLNA